MNLKGVIFFFSMLLSAILPVTLKLAKKMALQVDVPKLDMKPA